MGNFKPNPSARDLSSVSPAAREPNQGDGDKQGVCDGAQPKPLCGLLDESNDFDHHVLCLFANLSTYLKSEGTPLIVPITPPLGRPGHKGAVKRCLGSAQADRAQAVNAACGWNDILSCEGTQKRIALIQPHRVSELPAREKVALSTKKFPIPSRLLLLMSLFCGKSSFLPVSLYGKS